MATERSKKTEVITFRTTHENKKKLQEEAEKREWTIAQLVEKIVSLYKEDPFQLPLRRQFEFAFILEGLYVRKGSTDSGDI